jgi:hypothetical protein
MFHTPKTRPFTTTMGDIHPEVRLTAERCSVRSSASSFGSRTEKVLVETTEQTCTGPRVDVG